MKNFRKVTFTVLTVIILLFIGNIYYLCGLYNSIKEQQLQTAYQCMRQSDLIELITRLRKHHKVPVNDSARVDISIMLGSPSEDIDKNSIDVFLEMAQAFTFNCHNEYDHFNLPVNYAFFDSIFMMQLNREYIYPEKCKVLPADSVPPEECIGMWHIDYSIHSDTPVIYRAYISPLTGNILSQMAGIIVTSFLIIIAFAFAFYYLVRTVMRMRSIEEMKDDFTNNMTHELKTPIAIAYSANDALLNYDNVNDRDKQRRYLQVSLEQLTRLSGLVENILSMSMERRKTLTLSREQISLKPFIEEIAASQLLRADKPTDISVNVTPDDLTVTTDPTHLANVLNNLIDNAVKYSHGHAEIIIHADLSNITVSDRGMGIPAKSLPLIFNKFYRVPHGNRQDIRGYGIGLFYVRSILEKMGWSISAESNEGAGSTFTINFNTNGKQ